MGITKQVIEFALNTRSDQIPQKAIDEQKKSLLDAVGTMQAATTQSPSFKAFSEYALGQNGNGPCRVFGTGRNTDPVKAALANGALSHAMDFEDTCQAATLHSNAVTTPAILALAQYKGGVQGRELLDALVIGSEIACRLSVACVEDLVKYGWYMPPVFGAYGATLAGCRLLGLDYDQTLDALAACSYSATGSSQMMASKGSQMRASRDGFGAQAAVSSVLIAARSPGIGFEEVFEGKTGFFNAFATEKRCPELLVKDLGYKYYASELVFKYWPACLGTHTSIMATLDVMEKNDLTYNDIISVDVKGSEFVRSIVVDPREVKNRPVTAINAKFSLPYCIGLAAKRRKVQLSDFLPKNIPDEDIFRISEAVNFTVNPEWTQKSQGNFVEIDFHTTKGDYHYYLEEALGDPKRPLSKAQLKDKYKSCIKMSANNYSEEDIERISDLIESLDKADDCNTLLEMM